MAAWLTQSGADVLLDILVQPRASRTRVVGEHDGRLKIQLAAPPVDGAANEALLDALARWLGVRGAQLELVSGETGRRKRIRVRAASLDDIAQRLQTASGRE